MAFDGIKSLFKGAADGLQRLRFNAWTMRGHGAEIFEKSAEALELERINPLRGVDEWRLGQIFDDARDGIYADLAWLYNEIEGVEPALVACCDMRESAASECGWLVRTADAAKTRGFDKKLADDQRDALLEEFGAVDDDLAELAGHLVSAFFRGAAHALPLWNEDGSLAGFRNLDLWNFAFDRGAGIWYWNADASRDEGTFQPIPPGELVTLAVSSSRHVDHAALPIFIRAALGAKRYGVWLDRFGIPPVGVIMPPNAERGEQPNYMDLARKFARGGSGVLPNGSQVTYGTEARAVCPFQDFIRFQQQQIFTVGIGRVQSGDNQGENLGGNAAGVVEGGFRRLIRRDARRIARAINDAVTAKVLARRFPGKPALAQFAWDTEAKRTSREVLEDAGLAKNAGLAIDIDQVSQLTGYKLEKDSSSSSEFEFENGGKFRSPTPTRPSNFSLNSKTPLQTREEPLQIARKNPDGRGEGSPEDALVEALSGLFEKSLTEAAAEGLEKEDGEVKNSTDAQGNEHDDGNGQFTEKQAADKAGSSGDSGSSGKPAEAANNGKIDFRGNARAKAKADNQARALGYAGIDDLMMQSKSVTSERVAEIVAGGEQPCKPHEAIAVLRSHATIQPNVRGEEPVKLTERPIRHYVCGERRRMGDPDVSRLPSLPLAIKAIRECDSYHHKLHQQRIIRMPGEKLPEQSQTVYERKSGTGKSKAFAYTDSGVLTGWQLN